MTCEEDFRENLLLELQALSGPRNYGKSQWSYLGLNIRQLIDLFCV